MNSLIKYLIFSIAVVTFSCIKEQTKSPADEYYKPQIGDSFEWRLDSIGLHEVSQYNCNIIDIDAFSATKELVAAFHA